MKFVQEVYVFERSHQWKWFLRRYLRCTVSRQSNVAEGAGLFSESNQRKMAIIVWALYSLKSRRSHHGDAIIDIFNT